MPTPALPGAAPLPSIHILPNALSLSGISRNLSATAHSVPRAGSMLIFLGRWWVRESALHALTGWTRNTGQEAEIRCGVVVPLLGVSEFGAPELASCLFCHPLFHGWQGKARRRGGGAFAILGQSLLSGKQLSWQHLESRQCVGKQGQSGSLSQTPAVARLTECRRRDQEEGAETPGLNTGLSSRSPASPLDQLRGLFPCVTSPPS